MSKLYIAGCVVIGIGCGLMYAAGRSDERAELKITEADTWTKANTDHSEPVKVS